MALTVLLPKNEYSAPLCAMLETVLPDGNCFVDPEDGMAGLRDRCLLFAVALDESGCNEAYYRMLSMLRRDSGLLAGCVAGVVVTGVGEFYTKDVARDMVFAANQAGCAFLGRPLVEATGSMRNFRVQAQIGGVDERTAFRAAVTELIERLDGWQEPETIEVEEIGLRSGSVPDCNGCSYTACLHFGEQGSCFYGGPMVEEVYPAVRRCDALMMLCANYNDALSANLTACVTRQATVRPDRLRLFRRRPAGAAADLCPEHEQVLLPAAALLSAGDRE